MKFFEISSLDEIRSDSNYRVAALGYFDGIHIAHQEIINNTVELAKKEKKIASLITFTNNPKEYFTNKKIKLITPNNIKIDILKELGIQEVYFLEFNEEIRRLTKEKFISHILNKLKISNVFCGEDYRFGYRGEGTPGFIKKYSNNNINVNILKIKKINSKKISSTTLRDSIINGEVMNYKLLTNRYYQISGVIVKGRQLGRTINFPTANLFVDDEYIIPNKLGVYVTIVELSSCYYKGITNIGINPTVSDSNKIFIETHILNFNREIYGERMNIYFYEYIRAEKKFNNIQDLKKQLQNDKEKTENIRVNFKNFIL